MCLIVKFSCACAIFFYLMSEVGDALEVEDVAEAMVEVDGEGLVVDVGHLIISPLRARRIPAFGRHMI